MSSSFDLVHCGHADACRQAKLLADYLIVGAHSDSLPSLVEVYRHQSIFTRLF